MDEGERATSTQARPGGGDDLRVHSSNDHQVSATYSTHQGGGGGGGGEHNTNDGLIDKMVVVDEEEEEEEGRRIRNDNEGGLVKKIRGASPSSSPSPSSYSTLSEAAGEAQVRDAGGRRGHKRSREQVADEEQRTASTVPVDDEAPTQQQQQQQQLEEPQGAASSSSPWPSRSRTPASAVSPDSAPGRTPYALAPSKPAPMSDKGSVAMMSLANILNNGGGIGGVGGASRTPAAALAEKIGSEWPNGARVAPTTTTTTTTTTTPSSSSGRVQSASLNNSCIKGGRGKKEGGGEESEREGGRFWMALGVELNELERAIGRCHDFLRDHETYPYLSSFLHQFSNLATQMTNRVHDLHTLYSFLKGHQLSASKTSAGYFSVLPQELCLYIMSYLDWRDLVSVGLLNRQWQSLSRDNMLWKALCTKRWRDMWNSSIRSNGEPLSVPDLFSISALSSSSLPASTISSSSSSSSSISSSLLTADNSSPSLQMSMSTSQLCSTDAETEAAHDIEPLAKRAKVTATTTPWSEDEPAPFPTSHGKLQPPWLDVFKGRLLVEQNWQVGNCTARTLSPQSRVDTTAFCLHFDDERFVTATDSIEVFNVNTGELVGTLRGHTDSVMCLDFNKEWIVSGSKDNTIRVWDIKTGRERYALDGHANGVRTVRFDSKKIVSGSRDATIKIWDLEKGLLMRTMAGHAYTVYCLEFDDRYIISGSVDKTIRVWDIETGEVVTVLKGHGNSIRCLKFDQSRLVSGAWDNNVKLWDIETSKCITAYKGHTDRVMCLQFDHNKIVSGSVDKTIRIWDMRTNISPIILKGHSSCVYDLHFDPFKIVSAGKDRGMITWDFRAPRPHDRVTWAKRDNEGSYVFENAGAFASSDALPASTTPS